MKRLRLFVILGVVAALLAAGLLAAAVSTARAAPGASYTIGWYTVDGGGGTSTGSGYTLNGTAGQPDAGTLSGTGYTLGGGFWGSLAAAFVFSQPCNDSRRLAGGIAYPSNKPASN